MIVVTDLEFKLRNTSLEVEKVLLKVCLVTLKSCDLLLEFGVFTLLSMVALLHLIFGSIVKKQIWNRESP
jgi:hypothetical protein